MVKKIQVFLLRLDINKLEVENVVIKVSSEGGLTNC